MVPTINHLQQLDSCGIAFHSYTEVHLATDNELGRNVLLAVMSSLAKVKAEKISERVNAGLQRAVAKGKTLGRPRIDAAIERKARKMLANGVGMLKAASTLGVGSGSRATHRSRNTFVALELGVPFWGQRQSRGDNVLPHQ
jgi:DNA invertase Pin-like site-specific DNA recombinase